MKIRLGFISNSSSTSFCIYGLKFEYDDFLRALGSFEDENFDRDKLIEKWKCEKFPISIHIGNSVYIGTNIENLNADKQNKVEDYLRKFRKYLIEFLPGTTLCPSDFKFYNEVIYQ